MTIGGLLVLGAIAYGVHFFWVHRNDDLEESESLPPQRATIKKTAPAARLPLALDQSDLDEMDGMFGAAGSRPEDYK